MEKLIADFNDHPELPAALCEIAERYGVSANYEAAVALYETVIADYPDSNCLCVAGLTISRLIESGQDTEVQAGIDKLIADFNDHPGLPRAVLFIGEVYYVKALSAKAEGLPGAAIDCYQRAAAVWEKAIQNLPETTFTAHAYYSAAYCYRRLDDYEKAIEYYQKLADWPGYGYAGHSQYLVGLCYERQVRAGVLTKEQAEPIAEEAYKAVVENYPNCDRFTHAAIRLARMNFRPGQWLEAAKYYELYLSRCSQDQLPAQQLFELAQAYDNGGQLEEAIKAYNEFLVSADPNDSRIKCAKARLEELGEDDD